jgi:hypothetical protein
LRLIKMLGLAAIAAAAVLAFVGATTASAETGCKVSVADSGECLAANRYALPLAVTAKSIGKATLLAEGLETKCTSEVVGEAKTNEGAHTGLLGLITAVNWSACEGSCKSAKSEGLPWKVLAVALTLLWHISKDPTINPSALLECSFFGIPVNCLYEAESVLLKFTPSANSTSNAQLAASGVPLKRGGDSSVCPANGAWDGTYEVTNPKPLWLAALP